MTVRRGLLFVVLALALLLPLPALSDHVNEPQTPITGVGLRVFDYPNAVTVLTKCDGSETVNWVEARAEIDVISKAKPSEHFDVRVEYYEKLPDSRGRLNGYLWTQTWKHSNVPPHTATDRDRWEHASANQRLEGTSAGTFVVSVTALETGARFTARCSYRVAN